MLFKIKVLYSHWLKIYKKIGKPERFGIGDKVDALFIEVLELIHLGRFSAKSEKLPYLEKAITRIDKIKFFAEVAWENKMFTSKEYSELLEKLQEIGRELGGWKKGMVNKNSRA